jgi:manganese transport protein
MLNTVLGSWLAPYAFALALLCAGQSSTITGTLAGQITMEGFLNFRVRPWLQRLVTRLLAIAPAVLIIFLAKHTAGGPESGNGAATAEASSNMSVFKLLIFSQVILSLQLPFAVIPLVKFTSSARKMGPFVSPRWVRGLAWLAAAIIVALNVWLVGGQIIDWAQGTGEYGWILTGATLPVAVGLAGLLLWMTLRRETPHEMHPPPPVDEMVAAARETPRQFHRIGVALEAGPQDVPMLAQAIDTAAAHHAELVLMHVVGSVGGQWYGAQTGDMESRQDEQYLADLSERLRQELRDQPVSAIHWAIGYGDVPREIVRIVKAESIDLLVMGGHGHKTLGDMIHGETIQQVRHGVNIPVLAVRRPKDQA